MNKILTISKYEQAEIYKLRLDKNYIIISSDERMIKYDKKFSVGENFFDILNADKNCRMDLFPISGDNSEIVIELEDGRIYSVNIYSNDGFFDVSILKNKNYIPLSDDLNMTNGSIKTVLNTLPTFYAKYIIKDKIELLEASENFFKFYGTSMESYKDNSFFQSHNFSEKQINELVKKARKHENASFTIETYCKGKENDIIYLKVEAGYIGSIGDFPVYMAIFLDITDQKMLERDLRYEKERYKAALESTNDVIYEYDIKHDNLITYGNTDKDIPADNIVSENFLDKIDKNGIVNINDEEKVKNFFTGKDLSPIEVQFIYNNKAVWIMITGKYLYDNSDKPARIIGKIRDINERKLKELQVIENSYRDKLTALLKKTRGEQLIRNYLAAKPEDEVCSAFIVDLDNFGEINNTYSFLFGDTVLQEVAGVLKREFDDNAVISRIGGDEFLIFCGNTDREKAENIAEKICESVKSLYTGENVYIKLSCSIGMVSSDIVDYDEIMKCVERSALYVKQNGKNGYKSYHDLPDKDKAVLARIMSLEREMITSESIYSENDDSIIEFTFDLLEKTRDLKSAVKLLLTRIGKYFDFDRISIIEIDSDFLVYNISYQWDIMNKKKTEKEFTHLPQSEIDEVIKALGDNGELIVSKSFNEFQSTFINRFYEKNHVLFIEAMYEEGKFIGMCIYEDFDDNRVWSRETKSDIKEITKIIATHISRENADIASNAKSAFLSRMSHNIRTPMNAITGMTEIAKTVIDDKEKTINCLDKIEISTKYLIDLINDILDMSSIESGRLNIESKPFDLNEVVKIVSTIMEEQANEKNVDFHVYIDYKDNYLIGDGMRLNQVLVNMVNNAVKFTDRGGRVDIKVYQIGGNNDEAVIKFEIIDTGIGIDKDKLKNIFRMFERIDSMEIDRGIGTGLGLAISSSIVKMMGGCIYVESEPNKGSNFSFELTLKKSKEEIKKNDDKKEEYNFKGKRMLLVEDDELNAEIAQSVLEMVGFEVELAENGQIAVDMFKKCGFGYYDGILMDIRMPVMNGFDATRNIRSMDKKDSRTIPIIAFTADAFNADEQRSLESGMNAHLSKPINAKMLYSVLNNLIKG